MQGFYEFITYNTNYVSIYRISYYPVNHVYLESERGEAMKKKILMVRLEGYPSFVPMVNSEYEYLQREITRDHPDIGIPNVDDMIIDKNVLWYINTKKFSVHIHYSNGQRLVVEFDVGFQTDNGSIPSVFQSVIKNNDPNAVIGFWVHDLLFQTKYFGDDKKGFRRANKVLTDICRYYGENKFNTALIGNSVNSPIGWWNYKKRLKRDRVVHGNITEINKTI